MSNTNKLKIYLSKSKAGSIEVIQQVKKILSQYENIQILEFEGGEYNTNKLEEADIVLIIPPKLPEPFKNKFTIGKGQDIELSYAIEVMNHRNIYHLISFSDELYVVHSSICFNDIINIDWQSRYCEISYDLKNIHELSVVYNKNCEEDKLLVKSQNTSKSFTKIFSDSENSLLLLKRR